MMTRPILSPIPISLLDRIHRIFWYCRRLRLLNCVSSCVGRGAHTHMLVVLCLLLQKMSENGIAHVFINGLIVGIHNDNLRLDFRCIH